MQTTSPSDKLPLKTKIFYGIGDIGNAIQNTALNFFLLVFYTDAALISPALASMAMGVGKVWDAVNDPLFGWISDRTKSKLGRRRVFMIYGALPLAIFTSLLWFVPEGMTDTLTFLWIALSFIMFDTFMTITSTPYYALTADLTKDYNERSSLTTWRMVFGVVAFMIGAAGTPVLVSLMPSPRLGYMLVGIIFGVICMSVLWISASGFREDPGTDQPSDTPPFKSFTFAIKSRRFLQLLAAYMLAQVGFTLIQTLMNYYITYQLGKPELVPLVMVTLLVSVLVFLFPWKWLADRWNKGPAYATGLAIAGVAMALTFFIPAEQYWLIFVTAVVAGIGFSANWVFPWAMVPDVVEYDELETGECRSGMFYGVWGFVSKLISILGINIAGWALQLSHYVPNQAQTEETLRSIRLFFGPVPALFFAISFPLLFLYPITRASHAEVMRKLKEKRGDSAPCP